VSNKNRRANMRDAEKAITAKLGWRGLGYAGYATNNRIHYGSLKEWIDKVKSVREEV
jgi:hypothetical protein